MGLEFYLSQILQRHIMKLLLGLFHIWLQTNMDKVQYDSQCALSNYNPQEKVDWFSSTGLSNSGLVPYLTAQQQRFDTFRPNLPVDFWVDLNNSFSE